MRLYETFPYAILECPRKQAATYFRLLYERMVRDDPYQLSASPNDKLRSSFNFLP